MDDHSAEGITPTGVDTHDFIDAPTWRGEFCWTGSDGIIRCSGDPNREPPLQRFPGDYARIHMSDAHENEQMTGPPNPPHRNQPNPAKWSVMDAETRGMIERERARYEVEDGRAGARVRSEEQGWEMNPVMDEGWVEAMRERWTDEGDR